MINKLNLSDIPTREIAPGHHSRLVHTDRITISYVDIEKDATLSEHRHENEQIVNMIQGEYELTVDGKSHHLRPGDVLVIPSNVPHSGRAITDCTIYDVFQPPREDYR